MNHKHFLQLWPPGPMQREQAKGSILTGRDLTAYFPSCCLRFRLLISLHVGADCDFLRSLVELVGTPPAVFPPPAVKPGLQLLPGSRLPTHLAPQLLQLPPY